MKGSAQTAMWQVNIVAVGIGPLRSGFALNDKTHVPRSMRYMVVNDSFGCVPPCCAVRE